MPYGGSPARRGPKAAATSIQRAFRQYRSRVSAGSRWTRGSSGGMGRRGLMPVMARLHAFKRVCEPIILKLGGTGTVTGANLTNAGTGTAFPYLNVGNSGPGEVLGTVKFAGAFAFMLAQVARKDEITDLFDNYRIRKVVLRFDLLQNQAPAGMGTTYSTGFNSVPLLSITPDFDDNAVPTNREQVLQNSYVRTIRLDRPFTMSLTPRAQATVSTGTAAGAVAAGGLLPSGTWLDNGSPQVPHFGAKFWMDNMPDINSVTCLMITPTYYLECKNVN